MRYLIFILILFSFSLSLRSEIILSQGEILMTPNEFDFNKCLNDSRDDAHRSALEKVVGESITSRQDLQCSSEDENYCDFRKRTFSLTQGIVIPKGAHNFTHMTQGDIWKCNFEQTVEVVKFTTYPDFEFKFSMSDDVFAVPITPEEGISKNDDRFKSINFDFDPQQPSYLYLFQNTDYLNKGKSFFKIFPNEVDQNNLFDQKINIPTNNSYEFKVSFPSDLSDNVYYVSVIAIASEKEISFYDEYSYDDFQTKLFEIMNQKYRYKSETYTVIKKD